MKRLGKLFDCRSNDLKFSTKSFISPKGHEKRQTTLLWKRENNAFLLSRLYIYLITVELSFCWWHFLFGWLNFRYNQIVVFSHFPIRCTILLMQLLLSFHFKQTIRTMKFVFELSTCTTIENVLLSRSFTLTFFSFFFTLYSSSLFHYTSIRHFLYLSGSRPGPYCMDMTLTINVPSTYIIIILSFATSKLSKFLIRYFFFFLNS